MVLEAPDAVLRVLRDTAALYEAGNPEPWRPEGLHAALMRSHEGEPARER